MAIPFSVPWFKALLGIYSIPEVLSVPVTALKKHSYVIWRSGSGKSELMKVLFYKLQKQSHQDHKYSLIGIDPHGDLVEEMLGFHLNGDKEGGSDRILYFDFGSLKPSFYFNPLILPHNIKTKEERELMIDILSQELARVFQEMIAGSSLSLQMEALLVPCIAVLLRKWDSNFSELQRFMDDDNNSDLVALGQQSPHPRHQEFFKAAFTENSSYRLTKQSIYTKLQSLLNSRGFYQITGGKNTIDLETATNEWKVILFNLAQGKMGTEVSQLFGRMLIALLQSIALRRAYQSKASRKPTFLFIDECQNYVSASSLEKMLAESRKFGLHLILANQNLAQLEGKKLRETLLSNTNVKFVGANSPTTLQKMAKELGIKTQDFERMRSHQFYLRVGQNPARVFKPPAFLLRHKRKYFLKAKEKRMLVKKISQRV